MGCAPDPRDTPPLYISGCASEFNLVFVLLNFMPCFESINFYQSKLKIKVFWKHNTSSLSAGAPLLDLRNAPFPIAYFWLRVCYETYAAHTSMF